MVTKQDVEKISKLADVGIQEQELEEFTPQFTQILEYFEMLDQLPEKKADTGEMYNIFREDEVTESISQEDALRNAAEKEDGYFKAPRVM